MYSNKKTINLQLFASNKEPVNESTETKDVKVEETEKEPVELNNENKKDEVGTTQEKSLEQIVNEEQDKQYLAKQIVATNDKLAKMEETMNKLVSMLNASQSSFTSSQVQVGGEQTNSNMLRIKVD